MSVVTGLLLAVCVEPFLQRSLRASEAEPRRSLEKAAGQTASEEGPPTVVGDRPEQQPASVAPLDPSTETKHREFFESKIRPVLSARCYECHSQGANKVRAGLIVDNLQDLLQGGDSGPAILVGKPDESLLIQAVRHESFEMPPSGKLSEDQIADLAQWIQDGAWWPKDEMHSRNKSAVADPAAERAARRAKHWAWQPIISPPLPTVSNKDWPTASIDRFILAALESNHLAPSLEADRATLLRRLTFDLTGLPPESDDVKSFVGDSHPDAYERCVDRLIASPAFGEKWARHWLDLVRYAETCGHEFDFPIRHASGYRDYVVRAWNSDLSYDQWIREHIAGDLMTRARGDVTTGLNESILGTGFWWLGEANHAPTDVRADEADRMDNQLSVFGKTFLGLTIGCARCHDHKFDPISAEDYYALAGFLQSSRRQEALLDPHGKIERQRAFIEQERQRLTSDVQTWLASKAATPEYWSACLLATAATERVPKTPGLSNQLSAVPSIPVEQLEAWRVALATPNDQDLAQPLQLWKQSVRSLSPSGTNDPHSNSRQLWRERISLYDQALQKAQPFVDFRRNDLTGWFATGQALGSDQVTCSHVEACLETGIPVWSKPGTIDSGFVAGKLQGVLRSPTFQIQQRQIHHLIRGRGIHIRLVVDGYMMNEFSALLFADHMLKDVDTQGQWRWITQRNDLEQYLGHRAHLEYIDHGEGEWALQSVLFSDEPPPPVAIDSPIRDWVANRFPAEEHVADGSTERAGETWTKMETLALADHLGHAIHDAIRAVSDGRATDETTDLVNCLLHRKILQPEPELTASWLASWQRITSASTVLPTPTLALASTEGSGENEYLQIRGNAHNLGAEIPRRLLTAIAGDNQPPITSGSGRLELVDRMLANENPFVARVMVNRLWQHLFGRGLVATVDDFGAMGQPPSHPELLDFLAHDFRNHGWSLKRTLRQLVLSQTYRQSSGRCDADMESRDPENRYWHRADVRRLPAESLRDAILALSGRLDRTAGGPSIPVYLTDFMTARGQPPSGPLDGAGRRSIYTKVQRNFPSSMMIVFDVPTPFGTVGRRSQSNVPAQSLVLMNDPFVWSQAELWSQRICHDCVTARERLDVAAQAAWGRRVTDDEMTVFMEFLQEQCQEFGGDLNAPGLWTDVAHIFLNTKEFL